MRRYVNYRVELNFKGYENNTELGQFKTKKEAMKFLREHINYWYNSDKNSYMTISGEDKNGNIFTIYTKKKGMY